MSEVPRPEGLERRAAMAALLTERKDDLLVVPGLGSTCWDLAAASDSMLMQLPTPLDCIKSTARWPPSQAPAASATPSSSVVSTTS